MSEKVDFLKYRDSFPGFFLISAITYGKVLDEVSNKHVQGEPFDVELKINGVEVPFIHTLNELWARASNELENKARNMAKEMVTEAGLSGIMEILQKCEYELKDAIDKVELNKI